MTGVSENIMLGQLAPLGTGSFGLMLDEAKLADAIEVGTAVCGCSFLGLVFAASCSASSSSGSQHTPYGG